MKKTLVSLSQQKFTPLSNVAKNLVRGGERTGGGCEVIKFERANGKDRDYVKEWSSARLSFKPG